MNSLTNLPPLKPGYWWWNVAPLGEKPDWQQQVKPADVDPNRIDKIFGYETESFLKRQYRQPFAPAAVPLTDEQRNDCIEAWSSQGWGDRLGEVVRICIAIERAHGIAAAGDKV